MDVAVITSMLAITVTAATHVDADATAEAADAAAEDVAADADAVTMITTITATTTIQEIQSGEQIAVLIMDTEHST